MIVVQPGGYVRFLVRNIARPLKALLLTGVLLLVFDLTGCFYVGKDGFEDIVQRPPTDWSSRDCLTVIMSGMVHNLNDKEKNVEVIATPFYPSIIAALNQIQRTQLHWSEDDAKLHMDELLRGSSGLFMDWKDGRFVNAKGNYFRDQTDIDSLLILVTLKNRTWPCAVPFAQMGEGAYAMAPLMRLQDWPCYTPNIADIQERIWLLNEAGDTLRPRVVWGRRHESLSSTETLFVMFPLRHGAKHFLEHSPRAWLQIAGFDTKMKFVLDISEMR